MTNNLPAHLSAAIGAMEQVAAKIDTSSGDFNYLKLTKAGEWVHGAQEDEINEGSVFAVSTESFFAGFQAWDDDANLEGEETRLLTEPPLNRGDLEDVGCEWKSLIGFQLVCIEGDDMGLQLVYKTTSKGGIKAVNTLMKSIVAHVKSGKHDGALIPLIELGNDNYRHKKYGKIYTPLLDIVDWIDELPKGAAEAEPVAEKKVNKKVEEPEIDEEDAPVERPARRRRQRG